MPNITLTRRQLLAVRWAADTQLDFLYKLRAKMMQEREPEEDITAIDDEIELVNDVRAGIREVL